MIHSIFYVFNASIVPIVESENDEEMPPLMRAADVVDFTWFEILRIMKYLKVYNGNTYRSKTFPEL